jgi:hypothetical protein
MAQVTTTLTPAALPYALCNNIPNSAFRIRKTRNPQRATRGQQYLDKTPAIPYFIAKSALLNNPFRPHPL